MLNTKLLKYGICHMSEADMAEKEQNKRKTQTALWHKHYKMSL
jgi:hypothetical protein